jgi:hypothetical protein
MTARPVTCRYSTPDRPIPNGMRMVTLSPGWMQLSNVVSCAIESASGTHDLVEKYVTVIRAVSANCDRGSF